MSNRTFTSLFFCIILLFFFGHRVVADTSTFSVTVIIPQCNDSIDNDGDLLADYPFDPDCTSLIDNDESTPIVVSPACSDGIDNDGDAKIDFPADLGCDTASDGNESGEVNPTSASGPPGLVNFGSTGTQVLFQGTAFPGANVNVLANGLASASGRADKNGKFGLSINEITAGFYIFSLYSTTDLGRVSKPVSYSLRVARGSVTEIKNIVLELDEDRAPLGKDGCVKKGDMNGDCRVDLVDFSILAFWWEKPLTKEFLETENDQLNDDDAVSLEDFSVLAYHWTG